MKSLLWLLLVLLAVVISLKKWLLDKRTPSNVKCQQSQSSVQKPDDDYDAKELLRGRIKQF